VFFGVVIFLIKKYYYCNGEKDSTFDLLKKSQRAKVNICVVGAGFSGLCMGVKLKNAGIKFQILEKDSEVGGTWSANKYPGCRCDVWSVLYQLSFFFNPNWSTYQCPANEIRNYQKTLVAHFGLQNHIRLNTGVKRAVWDQDRCIWIIETDTSETLEATHLISGCGVLRTPNIPDFKGIEKFKGKVFHSAQWDVKHNYKNQKVALIGSGASAVQIAPAIVDTVDQLYVFQRTPNWIAPRPEANFPEWYKTLLRKIPFLMTINYWLIFTIFETLALIWLRKGRGERLMRSLFKKSILKQVNGDVKLAEKLTPKYEIGCKRLLGMNDFVPMFANKPNAHLITEGIEEFTETGIKSKTGQEIDLDLAVLATGFKIEESICGFEIIGKNGVNLRQQFDDFPVAFNGITVPNFPNFFILLGPNTVLAHSSVIFMIECQADYILNCVKNMLRHSIESIEVKDEKASKFRRQMDKWSLTRNITGACQGWYKNKDGINFVIWPSNLLHYWWITRKISLLENYRITFGNNDENKVE